MVNKIFAVIIIVLLFFLIYILFINTNKLLPIQKMKYHKVKNNKLSHIVSNNYYFSIWYNIHGIKNHESKYSLLRWINLPAGNYKDFDCSSSYNDNLNKVGVFLNSNLNKLMVNLNSSDSFPKLYSGSTTVTVNDIPLNGWNNLIVNVNHNIVDIYINGELRKTQLSHALGKHMSKGSKTLCVGNNDLGGYIGNVTFGEDSISTEEAFEIYKYGLGQNPIKALFDKYRLKFSILEKKNELSSLEL